MADNEDKAPSLRQSLEDAYDSVDTEIRETGDLLSKEMAESPNGEVTGRAEMYEAMISPDLPQRWAETWTDTEKSSFKNSSPSQRRLLLRRHSEIDQAGRILSPVAGVAQKWGAYVNQNGRNFAQASDEAIGAQYTLEHGTPEQKIAVMSELESRFNPYGVENAEAQAEGGSDESTFLTAAIDERLGHHNFDQAASQVENTIQGFQDARLPSGEVACPGFQSMRGQMAALSEKNPSADLTTLYLACASQNPQVKAILQKRAATMGMQDPFATGGQGKPKKGREGLRATIDAEFKARGV